MRCFLLLTVLIASVEVCQGDYIPTGIYVEKTYVPTGKFAEKQEKAIVEPSKPAASSVPMHGHQCPKCGHIWYHTDASYGSMKDHTCPECGTLQYKQMVKSPLHTKLTFTSPVQSNCPGGQCPTSSRPRRK